MRKERRITEGNIFCDEFMTHFLEFASLYRFLLLCGTGHGDGLGFAGWVDFGFGGVKKIPLAPPNKKFPWWSSGKPLL